MLHDHLDYFQESSLGGRPTTKPGDHVTRNAHNRWFVPLYHLWGPAWSEIHWNCNWWRARTHMASHYTWGSTVTILRDFGGVLGRLLDTLPLGSHNLMVTALGSCVKVALSVCVWLVEDMATLAHAGSWVFKSTGSYILLLHFHQYSCSLGQWSGRFLGIQ